MMNNNLFGMLINAARNGGNPMQMIGNMAQSNPEIGQVMQIIQGKNPKELEQTARNMARERGIDINSLAHQMGLM